MYWPTDLYVQWAILRPTFWRKMDSTKLTRPKPNFWYPSYKLPYHSNRHCTFPVAQSPTPEEILSYLLLLSFSHIWYSSVYSVSTCFKIRSELYSFWPPPLLLASFMPLLYLICITMSFHPVPSLSLCIPSHFLCFLTVYSQHQSPCGCFMVSVYIITSLPESVLGLWSKQGKWYQDSVNTALQTLTATSKIKRLISYKTAFIHCQHANMHGNDPESLWG